MQVADVFRPHAELGALVLRADGGLAAVATEAEVGDEADVGAQRDEALERPVVELLDDEIGVDREPPDRMAPAELDEAPRAGEGLVEAAAQTDPLVVLGIGRVERDVDVPMRTASNASMTRSVISVPLVRNDVWVQRGFPGSE